LKASELKHLILIGSSTGGPGHLQKIVKALPLHFCGTLIIAQHLAHEFIPSFVNQLQQHCLLNVIPVSEGLQVLSGKVYVCSLTSTLELISNKLYFHQTECDVSGYNPDINRLFESASSLIKQFNTVEIILTGMGDDGVKGLQSFSESGGHCIAESESSAIVYGMPFQATKYIKKLSIQNLDEIIQTIRGFDSI